MIAYTYNKAARQYVGPSGRFVPRADIRAALDAVIDVAQAELRVTALKLQSGEMDLNSWYYESLRQIKRIILASGTLAVGGPHALTPKILGSIGADVKRQIAYLTAFARELENGLPLDGRFLARIVSYGESGRATYEAIARKADIAAGMKWERRVLGASDHTCPACKAEAAKGWQPAGKLAAIGSLTCLNNCRCSLERARNKPSEVVAMSSDASAADALSLAWATIVAFARGGRAKAAKSSSKKMDKASRSGKLHGAGNCGTGSGGFKPGNVCGKGGRARLAADIKAARAKTHASGTKLDRQGLRYDVRQLKAHRRNNPEAIAGSHAAEIRASLREHGKVATDAKASATSRPAKSAESLGVKGHPDSPNPVTAKQLKAVSREVAKMPPKMLDTIARSGKGVDVISGRGITDHPSFSQYKGVTPRGWPPGSTWDDVPGSGGSGSHNTIIVANKLKEGHGSANLVIHEHAHTYDHSVGKLTGTNLSETPEWRSLHSQVEWPSAYERNYPEEGFVESVARYYGSARDRKSVHPKVAKFLDDHFGE